MNEYGVAGYSLCLVESDSWTDSVVGGICFYLAQVVVSFIGALCITTFAGDYRVFFFLCVGTGFPCT